MVSEEIDSVTQINQDDFKAAVDQFAGSIKAVDEELESKVKSSQAKSAELFESVCLQSAMVFKLDEKPIPGIDAPSKFLSVTATRTPSASIALNPLARSTAHKQKFNQSTSNVDQAFHNAILLAHGFKESTTVFAQTLLNKNQTEFLPTRASEVSPPISSLDDRILRMEFCLTEVQSGIDTQFMEIQNTIGSLSTCRSTTKYGSLLSRCNWSIR